MGCAPSRSISYELTDPTLERARHGFATTTSPSPEGQVAVVVCCAVEDATPTPHDFLRYPPPRPHQRSNSDPCRLRNQLYNNRVCRSCGRHFTCPAAHRRQKICNRCRGISYAHLRLARLASSGSSAGGGGVKVEDLDDEEKKETM